MWVEQDKRPPLFLRQFTCFSILVPLEVFFQQSILLTDLFLYLSIVRKWYKKYYRHSLSLSKQYYSYSLSLSWSYIETLPRLWYKWHFYSFFWKLRPYLLSLIFSCFLSKLKHCVCKASKAISWFLTMESSFINLGYEL